MILQGNKRKKRMRGRWARPEEEEGPVSVTVVKNGPRSDPDYVLRSQNPAECVSANSQTGLTNGVPHKGLLQSKHKIRVDFKVSLFFVFLFFCWPRPQPHFYNVKNFCT